MKRYQHNVRRHDSPSYMRRGSVLVMVITLLSMLFVIGVAFLASMNFEADIIQAQRLRKNKENSVTEVFAGFTDQLRNSLMAGTKEPFGTGSPKDSIAGYAQLPMWHNLSSPIEPYQRVGGQITFRWHTDLRGLYSDNFNGPHLPPGSGFEGFEIDTSMTNGAAIYKVCIGGNDSGLSCGDNADCDSSNCFTVQQCVGGSFDGQNCSIPDDCPGGYCSGQVVVDADGDGIVDTVQVDASLMGFTRRQLAELSNTVNGRPDGKVFVGLRIIPHNGLVNLNESHPNLIQNVFNLDYWHKPGETTPDLLGFRHTPTQDGNAYSIAIEERILRRRGGLLPPNSIPPSTLYGHQFLQDTTSDMYAQLLPPKKTLTDHRFWLFEPDEMLGSNPNVLAWAMRMEPIYSAYNDPTNFFNNAALNEYDQSHLVTTVSYDDLLSRGGRVSMDGRVREIREAMQFVNIAAFDPDDDCNSLLPFEYADYPHTIDNNISAITGDECCATENHPSCEPNLRKGRLQLSLSWLDDNISVPISPGATRLIYDTFWMLVRNASGEYWGTVECRSDSECPGGLRCDLHDLTCQLSNCPTVACTGGQICDTMKNICFTPCNTDAACGPGPFVCQAGRCIDPWTNQSRREALVSRTAASLTANMLDYVDPDDNPTRVAIRSFDFSDTFYAGRDINLSLDTASLPDPTYQYVYGLERQPFITEVATDSNGTVINSRGIEIFNPYSIDLSTVGEYWIYEVKDPSAPNGITTAIKHWITQPIPPAGGGGPFTAFTTGNFSGAVLPGVLPTGTIYNLPAPNDLKFENGWMIYLVRRIEYETGIFTEIVVDQFSVTGAKTGLAPIPGFVTGDDTKFTMQRAVPDPTLITNNAADIWKATVPVAPENSFGQTLGNWNPGDVLIHPNIHPVELNPANTGSFTQFDPTNPAPGVAFPATGSMLLLLRHANRSLEDYRLPMPMGTPPNETVPDLAFTTWLDDKTQISDPATGALWATIHEDQLIDNGRMPVFDRLFPDSLIPASKHAAHHIAHNSRVKDTGIPGDIKNLPWGQLVFDYFTALPLDNRGPYRTYFDTDIVGEPHSQPRVDMDGLRVHGRIDINAAPLKVLEGLPLIPMERIPLAFRPRIRLALGFVDPLAMDILNPTPSEIFPPDNQAGFLNADAAFGVMAYREAREGEPTGSFGITTGDYGSVGSNGRAWDQNNISYRRGTGFLTVGELANIRYDTANANVRMDLGKVTAAADGADYVEAIARIAALGDWVTVRSHVYTIYGVIRGEIDTGIDPEDPDSPTANQLEDLEARSIRFQDTVDRLPTFLGQPAPVSLGERVIGKYRDIHNN